MTRAPGYPGDVLQPATPEEAVTLYGLAWTDTLHAPSPLPQYLAATYGGTPSLDSPGAAIAKPEDQVDTLAPAYPAWEPDAIWQALSTR